MASVDYSVRITAGLDATQLKAGLKGVKSDLTDVSTEAKRTGKDLDTLGKNLKAGLGQIEQFGTAALGIVTALGLTSPALAGVMAKVSTEMFKLGNTIGEAVKPYVEWFAGAMEGINNFLDENPWAADLAGKILALGGALGFLSLAWKGLSFILGPIAGLINWVLGLLGFEGGLAGLAAAAGEAIGGLASSVAGLLAPLAVALLVLTGITKAMEILVGYNEKEATGLEKWMAENIPFFGKGLAAGSQGVRKVLDWVSTTTEPVLKPIVEASPLGMAARGLGNLLGFRQAGSPFLAQAADVLIPDFLGEWKASAVGALGGKTDIYIQNTIQMDGKTIAEEVSKRQVDNLTYMSGAGGG